MRETIPNVQNLIANIKIKLADNEHVARTTLAADINHEAATEIEETIGCD